MSTTDQQPSVFTTDGYKRSVTELTETCGAVVAAMFTELAPLMLGHGTRHDLRAAFFDWAHAVKANKADEAAEARERIRVIVDEEEALVINEALRILDGAR